MQKDERRQMDEAESKLCSVPSLLETETERGQRRMERAKRKREGEMI